MYPQSAETMIAMETSFAEQALAGDLETALTGLIKLTKALSFYPVDHPALAAASEETCLAFQPLLARHDTHPYHVTQKGFSLDKVPQAPNSKSLKDLAFKLVERRVRHLLFLPELTNYELLIFADELSHPAAQLHKAGGLEKQLATRQVRSIWINETDLEAILQNLREMEYSPQGSFPSQPVSTGEVAEEEQNADAAVCPKQLSAFEQMRTRIEQLKEPLTDENHARLLEQVEQLAADFFQQTGLNGYLALFSLLENHRKDRQRSPAQQLQATALKDRLLNDQIKQQLADAVAEPQLKNSQRRALVKLLVGLKMAIAPQLLKRLNAERDAIIRRHYTKILANMAEATFEMLNAALADDTWYQVRNVVTVLGETRLESALPLLTQVIDYPEVRVRRTIIRALGAIGGDAVIPPLLQLAGDEHEELHQPAIMALGALGNRLAIPPLVVMLKKIDPLGKKNKIKIEVIQALAATRSPQAIIPLLKLARRGNLLNRTHLETLRAEAILALGQLGNLQLIPVLDQLPKSDKGPVSRALQQATAQLRKQQNVA